MRLPESSAALILFTAVCTCARGELLPIRSYTTADGLASNHVDYILPDSHGFIWFCTPEGITRFDGYRMITFGINEGLPHRAVNTILETRSGEYFVGTANGLSAFRPNGGGSQFRTYRTGNNRHANNFTALLETASGRIWAGTADGLYEVTRDRTFRRQPLPGPFDGWDRFAVSDLAEDRSGNLWVGTTFGIFVLADNGAVQYISVKDGLPGDWVSALLVDSSGRVWSGVRGGLALMRAAGAGASGVQRVYTHKDGLLVSETNGMAEGSDGAMWVATGGGISRFVPVSGPAVFQNLTRSRGLIDLGVPVLRADRAGNIWAATEGAGVMRIVLGGFTTFREQDGLSSDRLWSVLGDRAGNVLAIDSPPQRRRQVNIFDGVKFHPVAPKVFGEHPPWGNNRILLQSRTGDWWAATSAGLCRYAAVKAADLGGRQPKMCYAPELHVFQIFEDSKGGIWASAQSRQGERLVRWDPATQALSSMDAGVRLTLISAFAEDRQGNIWMGSWGGGELVRYDGRQLMRVQPGGMPGARVFAMLADKAGRLWIASAGGLGLIANPGSVPVRGRIFNSRNGLASDTIHCLVEDNTGRIYAGTERGVDRLNPASGQIKHFFVADGLAHGRMTSAFRDASGNLWFATTQGLSRLTPSADRAPTVPSVRITEVRVPRARDPVSPAGETLLRLGELQPSQNQLQVEFVGSNNEPEESLGYAYLLEGSGAGWITTRQHIVNYAALQAGSYRFLVKAVNSEGQSSTAPAEIDFIVLHTIPGRWWFRTLAVLLAGSIIYLLYRYRLARLLEMERLRTRIATDLHDDIGSSLSQIAILSEVTSRHVAPEQQNELADIANLSRELVDSMSDIVWAIDPSQDRLGDLLHRMRRFAGDLLIPAGIAVHFQVPDAGQELPELAADIRRHIFLIFKEALHNILRHSGCTHVQIELQLKKGWLLLTLTDDGKGFDLAGVSRGHGLASMEQRAQQLWGQLTVDTAPGHGTTIRLRVPAGQQFIRQRKKYLHKWIVAKPA